MDKLKRLISLCKCGIHVTINDHRDVYETVTEYLNAYRGYEGEPPPIDDAVKQEMIKTDTIVNITFYPDTSVGSYSVYHYDLEAALDEALACFKSDV